MTIMGPASMDMVSMSPVGVRMAEAARMMTTAHERVLRMVVDSRRPSLTMAMTMTGSSKARPKMRLKVVTKEMYWPMRQRSRMPRLLEYSWKNSRARGTTK